MFYINAQESFTKEEHDKADSALIFSAYNPLLTYITRSNPGQKVKEVVAESGEVVGGNILRMLVHTSCINFHLVDKEILFTEDTSDTELADRKDTDAAGNDLSEDPYEGIVIPPGYYDMDEDN